MRDRLRRFIRPTREERARMLRSEAWWVVVGASVLVLVARLLPQDDFRDDTPGRVLEVWILFMVRTFEFHIGLLVLLVALVALVKRRWRLVLAAAPLVAFAVILPLVDVDREEGSRDDPAPTLRVMTANLLVGNDEHEGVIRKIRREDPDVLVFEEYDNPWSEELERALGDEYEYRTSEVLWDSFGLAVYSRIPFDEDETKLELELGRQLVPEYRVPLELEDGVVVLYAIHLLPPTSREYVAETRRQFADLHDLARKEDEPVIVAGDFNATPSSPQHAAMEAAGFRDAWDIVGRGRGATWPANSILGYLPGFRIDHLYLSRELTATTVERGTLPGSDHRYVVADVARTRAP